MPCKQHTSLLPFIDLFPSPLSSNSSLLSGIAIMAVLILVDLYLKYDWQTGSLALVKVSYILPRYMFFPLTCFLCYEGWMHLRYSVDRYLLPLSLQFLTQLNRL